MGSRGQSSASRKKVKTISGDVAEGGLGHDRFSPQDAATDRMAEYLGVSEKEAAELSNAVWGFTRDYSSYIRAIQNNDTEKVKDLPKPMREAMEKYAQNIEKYVNLAPKWDGGTTYRGINVSKNTVAKYKVGGIIDANKGTASWSSDREVARDFASGKKTKVVFSCKTQSKGTSVKHLAKYGNEKEVLVSKNAEYKITSMKEKNGVVYIDVKEV